MAARYKSGLRPALPTSLPFFLDTEFRKIEIALQNLPTAPAGSGGDVDGGSPDSVYLPTQTYDGGSP